MATPTSSRRYSRFAPTNSEAVEAEPTVSASVGHDHWANDVLKAVDKANSSGSGSPESYCDSETGQDGKQASVLSAQDVIKAKILEKKRKFHTGRSLELKNLPDGCVEQVRNYTVFFRKQSLSYFFGDQTNQSRLSVIVVQAPKCAIFKSGATSEK